MVAAYKATAHPGDYVVSLRVVMTTSKTWRFPSEINQLCIVISHITFKLIGRIAYNVMCIRSKLVG